MATMALDSPGFPDSPGLQDDDVVYPCKGCGEILEEGKAFELAGNRWHIDCFRCNTCGTLLDSDANLLLLGDGSLICNNCTYSCNACGNKIEDLAILTGDQAFCASCFRCRNCKRKIENLRYARTSQGIFCMSCHESLMARRRKKTKAPPRQATGGAANGEKVDKALPSLPPGAATPSAFSPDAETPPAEIYAEPQVARSPRHSLLKGRQEQSLNDTRRDVSPVLDETRKADGPLLPASTYNQSAARRSNISEESEDGDESRGFLPMAFDPTPVSAPPPQVSRKQVPQPQDSSSPENRPPRDYFTGARLPAKAPQHRDTFREEQHRPGSSRSASTERDRGQERGAQESKSSPHILYQDKARLPKKRDPSGPNTPQSASRVSPINDADRDGKQQKPKPSQLDTSSYSLSQSEGFKLQEAPKTRKPPRGSLKVETETKSPDSPIEAKSRAASRNASTSPVSLDSPGSGVNPFDDPRRNKEGALPTLVAPAPIPPRHADRPVRGDSLGAAALKTSKPATPEPGPKSLRPTSNAQLAPSHTRDVSVNSDPSSFADAASRISRDNSSLASPAIRNSFDQVPPRASSRPSAPSKSVANGDFIAPRAPPPPPPIEFRQHRNNMSISTMQSTDDRSDGQLSPALQSAGLPKHSMDGAFSMDDEMARIMLGDKRDNDNMSTTSMLRRVSNAVKHGRSFSDRVGDKYKSPHSSSVEISSPVNTTSSPAISSPSSQDPLELLRSHNRRQARQIAEQQAEIDTMRDQINNSAYIRAATSELNEKRNTISVLDTQREVVVAELESMTAHLKKAKDSNQPLDYSTLKSDILKDFGDSMQRLKDQLTNQIEDLMHKRNELTDEIGTLIQMKDKGFQEFESLQGRNAELIDMNNQLVHNIQETYKANRVPNGAPASNGLGIYHQPMLENKQPPETSVRNLNLVNTDSSMPDLLQETAAEPATVLTAPQVVNIRKGQPKKFNWRKGGEKMAKNITKGVKGAFVGESGGVRGKEIGAPYTDIGVPYDTTRQAVLGSDVSSLDSKQKISASGNGSAGFGFFGQKGGGLKAGQLGNMKNGSNGNLAAAADPSNLFGSELELRCAHENRVVPSIVSRCVDEVESRGMDVEGIYRKSGGNTQVKAVQAAFEKDGNYDISDPDLDIHAVTSALKQYFRKLPTPLITFDVYETFLEAGATQDKEKQAYNLRMAVAELPEHHRNCLEYLVQHLARVVAHEKENLMTPLNLAVVFAPTIMRPLSIEREMSDMQAQRTAVQALLEGHRRIFPEE